MITINLTPVQHQIILDCLTIAEKQMNKNDLKEVAKMVNELRNEISLNYVSDKSKKS